MRNVSGNEPLKIVFRSGSKKEGNYETSLSGFLPRAGPPTPGPIS